MLLARLRQFGAERRRPQLDVCDGGKRSSNHQQMFLLSEEKNRIKAAYFFPANTDKRKQVLASLSRRRGESGDEIIKKLFEGC